LIVQVAPAIRNQFRNTRLQGPPSRSFLYGNALQVANAPNAAELYNSWAQTYGSIFQMPFALGTRRVILCDPRAIAHFFAHETWKYLQPEPARIAIGRLVSNRAQDFDFLG
jgi:hypothetical protein